MLDRFDDIHATTSLPVGAGLGAYVAFGRTNGVAFGDQGTFIKDEVLTCFIFGTLRERKAGRRDEERGFSRQFVTRL